MTDVNTASASPFSPAEAAALLRIDRDLLQSVFTSVPVDILRWRPPAGEWCALEVLGHLCETEERGFAGRIRSILAEPRPQFRGWDPDSVARARRDWEADPARIIAEFVERRDAGIALIESLGEADLTRGGDHPEVGFLTVRDLLQEWVFHDANHLRQLLANMQAYAWPHMGNAQRFSAPNQDESPELAH
ncbi:MAG: DinB family protein [Thermomicrobiales bacterium]